MTQVTKSPVPAVMNTTKQTTKNPNNLMTKAETTAMRMKILAN